MVASVDFGSPLGVLELSHAAFCIGGNASYLLLADGHVVSFGPAGSGRSSWSGSWTR